MLEILSDENFSEKVEQVTEPVLVDFFATWCGPCKMISPMVDKLAEEYAGKVTFYKLDVDDAMQTALGFDVRSIPTLILFKNGEEVDRIVGAPGREELVALLAQAL